MVCIDTSVLIATYRQPNHAVRRRLDAIASAGRLATCGQIWLEFIGGFRSQVARRAYAKTLSSFAYLEADRGTFELAAEWLATHRGFGPGDALIAATAMRSGVPLLTLDAGFDVLRGAGLELDPIE